MTKLPGPPAEVPVDRDLDKLAPRFRIRVTEILDAMRAKGHDPMVFEAFRSDERVKFLFGFGRDYDDGRGVVTKVSTGAKTMHRYGLAVDIISKSKQWGASEQFWTDLRTTATNLGMRSGDDWDRDGVSAGPDPDENLVDKPHVQWFVPGMPVTPTDDDWKLLHASGVTAVWQKYQAS